MKFKFVFDACYVLDLVVTEDASEEVLVSPCKDCQLVGSQFCCRTFEVVDEYLLQDGSMYTFLALKDQEGKLSMCAEIGTRQARLMKTFLLINQIPYQLVIFK